jgi:hypothetical protein
MRALLARGHQCGVSFLEFAVCMALVAIFVGVLLERALYYQEFAEKTAMEWTAGNIRSGLRYKVADLILANRASEIQTLADENPMNWLAERPPNYLGELDSAPADEPKGQWYFDRRNRRAMRVSVGAVTDRSPNLAGTWVSLVLVAEYGWFQ